MIDVFSKYGWIGPFNTKTGKEVANAFRKLIATATPLPSHQWTDKGTEFYNQHLNGGIVG